MDKVKRFLEKYVEWVAFSLGVLFLGWMIYGYVLDKPVKVASVGGSLNVTPAEIDHLTWDQPGLKLKQAIDNPTPPPPMGPVVDWPQKAIASRDEVSPAVAMNFPAPYTPLTKSETDDTPLATGPVTPVNRVTALPVLPPLVDLHVSGGHSNVQSTAAVAAGMPGQPPPPVGAAIPVAAVDINWRTVGATLHTADLAKAFAAANIPPQFSHTAILRVQLIRQERNAAGDWGNDTEIAPLPINVLEPMEPVFAPPRQQNQFIEWAEKNVGLIIQPPFYQVLQGEIWYPPGTKSPNEVDTTVIADTFDPKNPGDYKGDPNLLTPDERQIYDDYHRRQQASADSKRRAAQQSQLRAQQLQQQQQQPSSGGRSGRGSRGGGGGGGGSDGNNIVSRNSRPNLSQLPPPPPDVQPPPNTNIFAPPPRPNLPVALGQLASTLPGGSFDPSVQPDIQIWAHDPTVQAGKTYRYKLRYTISSPVARTAGVCNPQSLAQRAFIVSNDATALWTDPVAVESDTNFYAVTVLKGVQFDIFKWKNGIWQMQQVQARPGDMVGSVDALGTKTDFTTGWTLVDFRSTSNREDDNDTNTDKTIFLVSDNGTVLKKDLNADQHSAEFHRLLDQVNAARDKDPNKTASAQSP